MSASTKLFYTEVNVCFVNCRGILYQIRKGQLYRHPTCNFPSRCAGVEHFIRKIMNGIPDVELVINVSDWPQVPAGVSSPSPVFSFSKVKCGLVNALVLKALN